VWLISRLNSPIGIVSYSWWMRRYLPILQLRFLICY
jgi:hypothetical protein